MFEILPKGTRAKILHLEHQLAMWRDECERTRRKLERASAQLQDLHDAIHLDADAYKTERARADALADQIELLRYEFDAKRENMSHSYEVLAKVADMAIERADRSEFRCRDLEERLRRCTEI